MQDVASSSVELECSSYNSKIPEVDYGTGSKSTTTTTEKRRSISRRPAFRLDPITNVQTIHRHNKNHDHTSLVSDHENGGHDLMKDVSNLNPYDIHSNTYMKENLPRTTTYNSKLNGQRRDSQLLDVKEKESLSDAELVEYFAERMCQLPLTYGFKNSERFDTSQKAMYITHDKNIDATPSLFETMNFQKMHPPSESVGYSSFKSKTKRKLFLPKIGSSASDYEHQTSMTGPIITSSFRSGTDRFPKKHGKVPGPGMYDRVTDFPNQKQISSFLSRGIYFSTSFT